MEPITDPDTITPVHQVGDYWVKRDDLYQVNGARGGKARAARKIAKTAKGVVTYGSRTSPQGGYTAAAAADVRVPCVYVTSHGALTPEIEYTQGKGSKVIQVKPGYLSQCRAEALRRAAELGYTCVHLSMESRMAVNSTRAQVPKTMPPQIKRIVIVVGGGISAAGMLWGLRTRGHKVPVLGVRIGRDPTKQLNRWAPPGWEWDMEVVTSDIPYDKPAPNEWMGIELDPYYEAKCLPYIQPGDLFWVVGIRPVVNGRGTAL